jgi:hypothetical protein
MGESSFSDLSRQITYALLRTALQIPYPSHRSWSDWRTVRQVAQQDRGVGPRVSALPALLGQQAAADSARA